MLPYSAILLMVLMGVPASANRLPDIPRVARDAPPSAEQLEAQAQKGDLEAAHELGERCFYGRNGQEKDPVKAIVWYRLAAAGGHAGALSDLGWCHLYGLGGLPVDDLQALACYRQASAKGHSFAMEMVGWMYEVGRGVPKDEAEAAHWYERSAALGDVEALVRLAWMTEQGQGIPKNEAAAAQMYAVAVSQGNAQAMTSLGWFYVAGRGGLEKDYALAKRLFETASSLGNARADGNLGYLYENGLGLTRNLATSTRYFGISADAGDQISQTHLAHLYESGQLISQDQVKAFHYYRLAAEQGDLEALDGLARLMFTPADFQEDDRHLAFQLAQAKTSQGEARARMVLALGLLFGVGTSAQPEAAKVILAEEARAEPPSYLLKPLISFFRFGIRVPKDPAFARSLLTAMAEKVSPELQVEAAKWQLDEPGEGPAAAVANLKRMSEAGNLKATFELGLLYQNGRGLPRSGVKALRCFHEAADKGLAEAMFHLGVLYQAGILVKQQADQARQWYQKAEAAGWVFARGHVLPDGKLAPLTEPNHSPGRPPASGATVWRTTTSVTQP